MRLAWDLKGNKAFARLRKPNWDKANTNRKQLGLSSSPNLAPPSGVLFSQPVEPQLALGNVVDRVS